jgi:cell division transport system permease protein
MKKKEDLSYNLNMFSSLERIIKSGWINFRRQTGASLATCFIMVLTISLVTSLFLFQKTSQFLISSLEEKIDISVYFKQDSPKEDILKLKDELNKIPEVKEIKYISEEEALEKFTQRHKQDQILIESLKEVGENPFLASLSIKAFNASQYGQISQILENSNFQNIIDKVDYYERKTVIDRIFSLTSNLNRAGIFFSLILGLIAILVTFNTIRLTIYNSREEIRIMRLVGASNRFIRGPFLVQGALAGIFAVLISLLILTPCFYFLSPKIEVLFPGLNIFSYFTNNFWTILLIQFAFGIGMGIIPSLIAIRKYLEV